MTMLKICKVSALKDGKCGASAERAARIIYIRAMVSGAATRPGAN